MDLQEFAISAWVKVEKLIGDCCNMIVSKEDWGAGRYRNYSLWMRPDVIVGFTVWDDANGQQANFGDIKAGSMEVTDDEWHHVVGSYDGEILQVYVDGADFPDRVRPFDRKAEKQDPRFTGEENINIGAMGPTGVELGIGGLIDDVAVFSKGLTKREVQTLRDRGLARLADQLGLNLAVHPEGKLATTWATLKTE